MHKILTVLFCSLLTYSTEAQILPIEGSELNYRLIGFASPEKQDVVTYKIEIAAGSCNKEDSFQKNIILSRSGHKNKIIGEVPSFGKQYTWRSIFTDKNGISTKSELHHFSTLIPPEVDTNLNRLRIIKHTQKHKDTYVFLDATRCLYDMNGMPVWFLLNIDRSKQNEPLLPALDLKRSPYGSITYMYKGELYDINYNGNILWNGPDNDVKGSTGSQAYHHEFTRLANSHYMALKNEQILYNAHSLNDNKYFLPYSDSTYNIHKNDTNYHIIPSGTLVEYDKMGNVVWTWASSKYIESSDLFYSIKKGATLPDLHDNAFFFDEQNKTVYISFRNISRIVKIKYPEGTILNTYGELYAPGIQKKGNQLFSAQHACKRSESGYLYLFNNNSDNPDSLSSIVVLHEPQSAGDTLRKIWEYKIRMKTLGITEPKTGVPGGGNVVELPDHSFFVAVGYYTGAVFIVNRNKEITWSAIPERWNTETKEWSSYNLAYRASIITNKQDLEDLVWGIENDNTPSK